MNHDERNEPPTPSSDTSSGIPKGPLEKESTSHEDLEIAPYNLLGPEVAPVQVAATTTEAPWRPPRIGRPLLAWLFIVSLVTFVVGLNTISEPGEEAGEDSKSESLTNLVWEFQGKLIVGVADIAGGMHYDQLTDDVRSQFGSTFDGRLRLAILDGEIGNPKAAFQWLAELNEDASDRSIAPSDRQMRTSKILSRLYADYMNDQWQAPSVDVAERKLIEDELGWYGQLALAPKQGPNQAARRATLFEAQTVVAAIFVGALVALIFGLSGISGCAVFAALIIVGKLRHRLIAGAPHGGVYAETFALWMTMFLLFSTTAQFISSQFDLGEAQFIPTLIAMFASLMALVWPVLRGVPWWQVRRDIGWTRGQNPLVEIVTGAVGWISTLPLVVIGVMMMFVLIFVQELVTGGGGNIGAGPQGPSHPIVQWLADAGWRGKLQLLFLACVAAPIVEETMFRGVLYRQLRDATVRWRLGASVLTAALLNSFVFAVIHPQGWLAVPTLMSLAVGFSLLREWRGSLLASMTAHGINNSVAMLVFFVLF